MLVEARAWSITATSPSIAPPCKRPAGGSAAWRCPRRGWRLSQRIFAAMWLASRTSPALGTNALRGQIGDFRLGATIHPEEAMAKAARHLRRRRCSRRAGRRIRPPRPGPARRRHRPAPQRWSVRARLPKAVGPARPSRPADSVADRRCAARPSRRSAGSSDDRLQALRADIDADDQAVVPSQIAGGDCLAGPRSATAGCGLGPLLAIGFGTSRSRACICSSDRMLGLPTCSARQYCAAKVSTSTASHIAFFKVGPTTIMP